MKTAYIKNWFKDTLHIFGHEMVRMVKDGGVMIIFIVAGFLYPILYYFVYRNGVLEETPIAIVDASDCSDSRRMIRELDATREVRVAYRCTGMEEAYELFRDRKVNGIVYFPSDFGDKIVHGETSLFSIYADMSSFLYYKNLLISSEFVMLNEVNNIKLERCCYDGMTGAEADASINTILYEDINPYNHAFSYSIFFLSAVLWVIIQQVMIYVMSIIAGTMREENRSFASLPDSLKGRGVGRIVIGRGAVYWLTFMLVGIYVSYIIPAMSGFPQRGDFLDILKVLMLYVTVCVFFSMTWSTLVTRRESVFILFLFFSPIVLFLTGFSWPETAFPGFWKGFSYLFPTTFGCKAFINLNTAGADLSLVAPEVRALTLQGIIYFVLACIAIYVENFAIKRGNSLKGSWKKVEEKIENRMGTSDV